MLLAVRDRVRDRDRDREEYIYRAYGAAGQTARKEKST
jgi:hypothetical protein